jgi:hypothetical protein
VLSKSLPLFTRKPTSGRPGRTSPSGQSTKSLRSSPLRGGKSREVGSQSRGQQLRGGKVNTIDKRTVRRAAHDQAHRDDLRASTLDDAASHVDPTHNAMTKIALTNSANQFA